MSDTNTFLGPDDHGVPIASDAVRLERWLPGPIERLWRYLTEPALRAQWLAGGDMALHTGGTVALVFHNNQLTPGDDDPPPAEFASVADVYRMQGRVTACEPPHLLAYTWSEESGSPSEVRFELTPQGQRVRLVLTHTRLATPGAMLNVSAGWHTHLAILRARRISVSLSFQLPKRSKARAK